MQDSLFLGCLQAVENAGEERFYCSVCSVVLGNRIDSLRTYAKAFHLNDSSNDALNVIPGPINNREANNIHEDVPAVE